MDPCLRGPMPSSATDFFIQHYVFPCQCLLLAALTLRTMRSSKQTDRMAARATVVLLTIVNIAVMLTMLPQSLASYSAFYENELFRRFVHHSKISINAVSNILSAIEVFLTLLVCIECLLRARNPASSLLKLFEPSTRYFALIGVLVLFAIGLNIYHFFIYTLVYAYRCEDTKMVAALKNSEALTPVAQKVWFTIQAIVVILIPSIAIVTLNRCLKARIESDCSSEVTECQELVGSQDCLVSHKRKVTRLLPIISYIFLISHMSSFLPFLFDLFPTADPEQLKLFTLFISVMNSVLLTGKILLLGLIGIVCQNLGKSGVLGTY